MPFLMPDISHYQPQLDAGRVASLSKVAKAVMLKATEGTGFQDPNFAGNVRALKGGGVRWGAYHFVKQGTGASQATFFWSVANTYGKPTFVVIDWEDGDRQTALDLAGKLRQLADVPVGIYSGAWSRGHGGPPPGLDFAMVPQYGPAQLDPQYRPDPYRLAAWQYTDGKINGTQMPSSIPGIGPCDVSVVYLPEALGLGDEDMSAYEDFKAGVKAAKAGEKLPDKASDDFEFGYRMEQRANANPKPGTPAPHTHNFSGTTGAG